MKIQKGFTLIELLAVIAILAVLVIIAIPNVLRLFKDAKKNAFEVEVQNIVKAAEQGYATRIFKGNVEETTYTYVNGIETKTGNIDLDLTGRKIQNGTIKIKVDGKISFAVTDGKYCSVKESTTNGISTEEFLGECEINEIDCSSCFTFNESTGEITDYKNTCPACTSAVEIPSTINGISVVSIGNNAFQNNGITSLTLSSGITEIKDYAFANNSLATLNTPDSVVVYGKGAFANNNLQSVSLGGPTEYCCDCVTIGEDAFRYNKIPQDSALIRRLRVKPYFNIPIGTNAFTNNGTDGLITITLKTVYANPILEICE